MEVVGVLDIGVITTVGDAAISANKLGNDAVTTIKIATNAVTNAKMADDSVGIAELSATGTASATTYLRGDNAWGTITTDTSGAWTSGTSTTGKALVMGF